MSNYTKSTNFATKDALTSGDPLKIVKGTEIDTEFNNIATAVATKADLASPTFTGTPALPTGTTAVTQSAGNSTTALATTAFVQAALQALHPVGSIYINAGVTTNPATLLGFGTWTAFGAGRVMVGLNGSDALFDTLEETGGSKDATVVSHSHTASSSSSSSFSGDALPGHQHTIGTGTLGASFGFGDTGVADTTTNTSSVSAGTPSGSVSTSTSTTVASTGSSATDANLQPYITVAMWKRTA
jgi:hypothetical protein